MDTECENCGMIGEPLIKDDCCAGCVCNRCGKSAFECGSSMNDMGFCDDCNEIIYSSDAPTQPITLPTHKYPNQCPCGIAATQCDYHR